MKQLISILCLFISTISFAQNVGIGTITPDEKLQVDSIIRVGKNQVIAPGSTRQNLLKFGDGNFVTVGEQDKDDRLVMKASSFTFKDGSVGIGVDSAKERLDVLGSANISGQLKFNSNAGAVNQVLMKNASNNPVWGNLSKEFKNTFFSICFNNATSLGTNNCTDTWVVPPGVTEIVVEVWGGGGGGGHITAGGGGGYATFRQSVTPGTTANLIIGAGGNRSTTGNNGIFGGTSSFTLGQFGIRGNGGPGGSEVNPLTSNNFATFTLAGGIGNANAINADYTFIASGTEGGISKLSFVQANATDFYKVVQYGDGGVAPFGAFSNGAKGGYYIAGPGFQQNIRTQFGGLNAGGGGAADSNGGGNGFGGMIIIHY